MAINGIRSRLPGFGKDFFSHGHGNVFKKALEHRESDEVLKKRALQGTASVPSAVAQPPTIAPIEAQPNPQPIKDNIRRDGPLGPPIKLDEGRGVEASGESSVSDTEPQPVPGQRLDAIA